MAEADSILGAEGRGAPGERSDVAPLRELLETQGIPLDRSADVTVGAPRSAAERELALRPLRLAERGLRPDQSGADLEIVGTLGAGGMGVVHLARQPSLDRDVAVKRLKAPSEEAAARLLREARITGRLEHPHVVPVHAIGLDAEGLPVVVMKRVSGVSWLDLRQRGVPLDRHVEILVQVCNAIHFAHQRGIVHRDVKLENVMVGELDEVYVLDWGVALDRRDAAAMRERGIVGTATYMAPEMVRDDPALIDERTDVYLLGATLHHALTGRPRHPQHHILAALNAALTSEPHVYPDTVPRELGEIANRACAAAPHDRYESALALRDALRGYVERRAARELAALGHARSADLARLLDAPAPRDGAPEATEAAEVQRTYDEACFAFREALRLHDDPAVRAARRAAAERLFDHRLAREDLGGALVLVDALDPEDAGRRTALEELRARVEQRAARLAFLEREDDPSIGRRPRVWFAVGVSALACAGAATMVIFPPTVREIRPGFALGLPLGVVLVVALAVTLLRRRLLATELSRRLVLTVLVALLVVLVQRVLLVLVLEPQVPMHVLLLPDQAVLTFAVATLALRLRVLWWVVAGLGIAWVLLAVLPPWQVSIFVISAMVAPAVIAWLWAREGAVDRRP